MSWHSEIEDKSYWTRMVKVQLRTGKLKLCWKFCRKQSDVITDVMTFSVTFCSAESVFPEIFQEVCWAAKLCFSVIRKHAHVAARLILVKPKLVVKNTKSLGLIKWTLAIIMEAQNWKLHDCFYNRKRTLTLLLRLWTVLKI